MTTEIQRAIAHRLKYHPTPARVSGSVPNVTPEEAQARSAAERERVRVSLSEVLELVPEGAREGVVDSVVALLREERTELMVRMLPPKREPLAHGPEGCGALEEARRKREDKIKKKQA